MYYLLVFMYNILAVFIIFNIEYCIQLKKKNLSLYFISNINFCKLVSIWLPITHYYFLLS